MTADADDSEIGPPEPRANPLLLGHEGAQRTFVRANTSGRMAHAWLIAGPRGIGKATFAYRAARYLLAGGGPDMALDPENGVFRRVAAGGHADFMALEPAWDDDRKRRRTVIRVDEVRELGAFLSRTAAEGGWRAVVVDSADDLNPNAANALLKMLEEPPKKAILLLVSHNPARLLPTIRSRCRRLVLGPLSDEIVADLLGRFCPDLTGDDRRDLSVLAEGSAGRAMALAAEGGLDLYRDMIEQLDRLPSIDIPAIHRLGDKIARDRDGETFRTFSELLTWWLARFIKSGAGGGANLDPWVEVWEKLTTLLNRAEGINLDRKQVVLNAFHDLQSAART